MKNENTASSFCKEFELDIEEIESLHVGYKLTGLWFENLNYNPDVRWGKVPMWIKNNEIESIIRIDKCGSRADEFTTIRAYYTLA